MDLLLIEMQLRRALDAYTSHMTGAARDATVEKPNRQIVGPFFECYYWSDEELILVRVA